MTDLRLDTNPAKIHQELETTRTFYRRSGFTVIDVTDRPIESTAEQVIDLITRRFGSQAHTS